MMPKPLHLPLDVLAKIRATDPRPQCLAMLEVRDLSYTTRGRHWWSPKIRHYATETVRCEGLPNHPGITHVATDSERETWSWWEHFHEDTKTTHFRWSTVEILDPPKERCR